MEKQKYDYHRSVDLPNTFLVVYLKDEIELCLREEDAKQIEVKK